MQLLLTRIRKIEDSDPGGEEHRRQGSHYPVEIRNLKLCHFVGLMSQERIVGRVHLLHTLVIRAAAALGNNPIDNLIRVGNIARLAVNAIRGVDFQLQGAV